MEQYILKSQSEMRKVGGGGALILEGEGAVGSSRNAYLIYVSCSERMTTTRVIFVYNLLVDSLFRPSPLQN